MFARLRNADWCDDVRLLESVFFWKVFLKVMSLFMIRPRCNQNMSSAFFRIVAFIFIIDDRLRRCWASVNGLIYKCIDSAINRNKSLRWIGLKHSHIVPYLYKSHMLVQKDTRVQIPTVYKRQLLVIIAHERCSITFQFNYECYLFNFKYSAWTLKTTLLKNF